MKRVLRAVEWILSIPKSFILSWKLTSFKRAVKLPVKCRYNVRILNSRCALFGDGSITIGFNRTGISDVRYQRTMLNLCGGKIIADGSVTIGSGSRIEVGEGAVLHFEGKVSNSARVSIICEDKICIGNNTVVSWDTLIIDTDFHYVKNTETGRTSPMHKPILIGKNTWICTESKVLKGAVMPDGCILSAGSVLNAKYSEPDCLLQGNPAVITRRGVTRSDQEVSNE